MKICVRVLKEIKENKNGLDKLKATITIQNKLQWCKEGW